MMKQKVYGDKVTRSEFLESIKNENYCNDFEENEVATIIIDLIINHDIKSMEELLIYGTEQLYEDETVSFATCENYGLPLQVFIRYIGKYYLYFQERFVESSSSQLTPVKCNLLDEEPYEVTFSNASIFSSVVLLVNVFGKKDTREFIHYGISKVDSSSDSTTICESHNVSVQDFLSVIGTYYEIFELISYKPWCDHLSNFNTHQ